MTAVPRIGLIELVILAAVALGALAVVWSIWRPRRTTGGQSCAACGYSTLGLGTFTCPECGSDLRRVGILTPYTLARRPSFLAAAAAFTALWAFSGALLGTAIAGITPEVRRYHRHLNFSSPQSGAFGAVSVDTSGWALTQMTPRNVVKL